MNISNEDQRIIETFLNKLRTEQQEYDRLKAIMYGKPLPHSVVNNSLMVHGGVFNEFTLGTLGLKEKDIDFLLKNYVLVHISDHPLERKNLYLCPQLLPMFMDRPIIPWITLRITALRDNNLKQFPHHVLNLIYTACLKKWNGDELLRYNPLLFSAFTCKPGLMMNLVQISDSVMRLDISKPPYPTELRAILEEVAAILEPVADITIICNCSSNISLRDTLENTVHSCARWCAVCICHDNASELELLNDGD